MAGLHRDIGGLHRDIGGVHRDIAELRERMARVEGFLEALVPAGVSAAGNQNPRREG